MRKAEEPFASVSSYGSDMGAQSYGRGGWTNTPSKFNIGVNGELRLGLIYNTTYNPLEHTGKMYFAPSYMTITRVEFDWETNYDHAQVTLAMDYPDHPNAWIANVSGPNGSGGVKVVVDIVGGAPWLAFGLFEVGNGFTYPNPTGAWYGRIYNLKVYYRGILHSKDSVWDYMATVGPAKHIHLEQVLEQLDWQPRRTRYGYTDGYGNVTVAATQFADLLPNGSFESWTGGTSSPPDSWVHGGGNGTIGREGTIVKLGAYSARVTSDAGAGGSKRLRYDGLPVNDYKGKTVTFGAWVYATTPNNVRLEIYDNDNTLGFVGSSYHSGNARWEFLTVSRSISPSATMVLFDLYLSSDSVTAYIDGAIATEGDERRKEMAYALNTDPAVWVVDRLSQEQVFGCEGGSVLEKSRTKYYYDRDAQGNRRAHGSAPTKGDLIAVEQVHLTDGTKTSFTDYWYDPYGNLTTEQDGRGNQTNATYDSTHHTFPATITNAKGQVETRQYDWATGKPTSVTDINGQVTTYEYDSYKRLTAVRKPGDATGTATLEIVYYVNTDQAAPRFAITTKQKDGSTGDGVYQGKTWYDGLGRALQARSENVAGSNPIVVDTAFEGRGLKASESVPYVQTGTLSDIWAYTAPPTATSRGPAPPTRVCGASRRSPTPTAR